MKQVAINRWTFVPCGGEEIEIEIDAQSGLLLYFDGRQVSIDLGSVRSAVEIVDPEGFSISRSAACMLREIMADDAETDDEV